MKNRLRLAYASLLSTVVLGVGCAPAAATTADDAGSPTPGVDDGTPPGADGGDAGDGGAPGPAKAFHAVTGADPDDRITGIYCPTAAGCVVAVNNAPGTSHLYAIDANQVNATPLFTADDAFSDKVGVVGSVSFLGFSKVGGMLIARTDPGGGAFVTATADPMLPASWSATTVGHASPSDFALNAEYGFGVQGTNWIQVRNEFVYTSPTPPSPTAAWTTSWSPGGPEPIPNDLADLHAADPTLCLSEVAISSSPRPTQAAYVAADGAIVLYTANGLNQQATDADSGVCISTDGGNRFHLAKLPGLTPDINGPTAMTCTSKDHCVVAGGMVFTAGSSYVYVSNDASKGAASTWTKSTIPATTDNTLVREIFFAPDGTSGWLVGGLDGNQPMLWATTDGGATWTDQTGKVAALTDRQIWSGYAFDATHVVLGSETGKIISSF